MKYILSTTGEKISFMLDKEHKFIFDTIIPTEVTDEQFIVLNKRLGVQLKCVDAKITSPTSSTPKVDSVGSTTTTSTSVKDEDEEE